MRFRAKGEEPVVRLQIDSRVAALTDNNPREAPGGYARLYFS
jgi:hypothetical protein